MQVCAKDGVRRVVHWPRNTEHADAGVLLVVHGICEHVGRWSARCQEFADLHGFDVFAYDHVGHGLSEGARTDVRRPTQLVDEMVLVAAAIQKLDNMSGRSFFVYGHR